MMMSGMGRSAAASAAWRERIVETGSAIAHDRRRWLSFLTWAFVLSEVAGRDGFLPATAHAAADDAPAADGASSGGGAPITGDVPTVAVTMAGEAPTPIISQQAAAMPGNGVSDLPADSLLAQPVPLGEADGAAAPRSGGGGGGGGPDGYGGADAHAGDIGGHAGDGIAFGTAEAPTLSLDVAAPLQLGLHLDLGDGLSGVVGDITGTLAHVPLLGSLTAGLGDTLVTTADGLLSVAEPVVSVIGLGGSSDGGPLDSALGVPGQLLFAGGEPSPQGNELATPAGGYSNYGISLSVGSEPAFDTGHASDGSDAAALDAHLTGHLPGEAMHLSSDATQHDHAILRAAGDVLA